MSIAEETRNIILLYESEVIFRRFSQVFGERYEIFWGKDLNTTMDILAERNVGVMICDIHFYNQDIYPVVLALKHLHPELVTMVVSRSADVELLLELEAQEEIFVTMVRPVTRKQLNETLDSAFNHYLAQREMLEIEAVEASSHKVAPFLSTTLSEKANMDETGQIISVSSLPDDILDLNDFGSPEQEQKNYHEKREKTIASRIDNSADFIFFEDLESDDE